MKKSVKKEKRHFLNTIKSLQEIYDSHFGDATRTFSYIAIYPNKDEEKRLEEWFRQTVIVKKELYRYAYEVFKKDSSKFLCSDKKIDYKVFFPGKGNGIGKFINEKIKPYYQDNLNITTKQPLNEGLRKELESTINSFISNHKREFNENIELADKNKSVIAQNQELLEKTEQITHDSKTLEELLNNYISIDYKISAGNIDKLEQLNKLIENIRKEISEHNYQINQIRNQNKSLDKLETLNNFGLLSGFPGTKKKDLLSDTEQINKTEEIFTNLLKFSMGQIDQKAFEEYFDTTLKKALRSSKYQRKDFSSRLIFHLHKKFADKHDQIFSNFIKQLDNKIKIRRKHASSLVKEFNDKYSRDKFLELIALRARLVNPDSINDINTLLSTLKGLYRSGIKEKQIVQLPGFGWDTKKRIIAPGKNVALAFKDNRLYLCLSDSNKPYSLGEEGDISYVIPSGGQRMRKDTAPKQIKIVSGKFLADKDNLYSVMLKLHFGSSYANRYFFHKEWGVFTGKNHERKFFINTAKLKRERWKIDEPWKYYLDITLSGITEKGFKTFELPLRSKCTTVIGIDRGENIPVAYAIIDKATKKVLKQGLLAEEYTIRLKKYFKQHGEYQAKGKTIPKWLNSKISKLKKTLLETASAEILRLVSINKSIIVIENLNKNFGAENKIISKKIYSKVEELLIDSLELAGILRKNTGDKGKEYYGLLEKVNPANTSQTCPKLECRIVWNRAMLNTIEEFLLDLRFKNVDINKRQISMDGFISWIKNEIDNEKLKLASNKKNNNERLIRLQKLLEKIKTKELNSLRLNEQFEIYNYKIKLNEKFTLKDIESSILSKDIKHAIRLLIKSIGPRIKREIYICPSCYYTNHADNVGAINTAYKLLEYKR